VLMTLTPPGVTFSGDHVVSVTARKTTSRHSGTTTIRYEIYDPCPAGDARIGPPPLPRHSLNRGPVLWHLRHGARASLAGAHGNADKPAH